MRVGHGNDLVALRLKQIGDQFAGSAIIINDENYRRIFSLLAHQHIARCGRLADGTFRRIPSRGFSVNGRTGMERKALSLGRCQPIAQRSIAELKRVYHEKNRRKLRLFRG